MVESALVDRGSGAIFLIEPATHRCASLAIIAAYLNRTSMISEIVFRADSEDAKTSLSFSVRVRGEETLDDLARRLAEEWHAATGLAPDVLGRQRISIHAVAKLSGLIAFVWRLERGIRVTELDLPPNTVAEAFEAQVRKSADAVAVSGEGTQWSYAELDARAEELAGRLVAAGVKAETPVAILMERSPLVIVASLAILKAGGAYVPLHPSFPAERMRWVLTHTQAPIVLTDMAMRERAAELGPPLLLIDAQQRTGAIPALLSPQSDQLAYVMFTSGSTGTPKGVAVTHADVVALAADHAWRGDAHRRVLMHSPHAFDASTYEMWIPLLNGGTVIVAPAGPVEPARLADIIARHRITAAFVTTALFNTLIEDQPPGLETLAEIWTGGEFVSAATMRAATMTLSRTRVVHVYGPTETTTFATCHPLPNTIAEYARNIPIGHPMDGLRAYVLDERLRLALPGVPGELYLAGTGLARGYFDRSDLTAERFIADPFAGSGERMYRTGDLVRWTCEGELEFLGRNDHQVKIRGFRIELGEVEAALDQLPGITQSTVNVHHDDARGKQIIGYVVPAPGHQPSGADLKAELTAHLPAFMVPTAIMTLDTFPLTPNGKIDRAALPAPVYGTAEHSNARTPAEEILAGLFAEILNLPTVDIHDNFFDLGGHSLLATRLISRVRDVMHTELTVRDLFESPTVATLAQEVTTADSQRNPFDLLLPLRPSGQLPPLFCIHPGMGFAWSYSSLLGPIDNARPLYAIQARSLTGPTLSPSSLDAMARDFVAQIKGVQPSGPYHLLGWSFGGLVAYAMATELREQGEEVALLTILDSYPGSEYHIDAGSVPENEALALILDDLGRLVPETERSAMNRDRFMEIVNTEVHSLRFLTQKQISNLIDTWINNIELVRTFTPARYDGDLLFFVATQGRNANSPLVDGWAPYVNGQINDVEICCRHGEMMQPNPAAEIGWIVSQELDRVRGKEEFRGQSAR
ncbi:amino acid adenylation domain-containing protein [Nonomuraea cypriaca]|nr:amino acid adenylation domain-containing protein [Nonomuraea cypriaca]